MLNRGTKLGTYEITSHIGSGGMEGQETTSATQINVVLNWFEELKRRVPANTE